MRKLITLLCLSALVFLTGTTMTSCSRKSGCPVNENAHVKPNRKGEMPTKRGRSNLFPKTMRKRGK